MKRLAVLLLAIGACTSASPASSASVATAPSPQLPGAATARAAIDAFLAAAQKQDLQAMSLVWGGSTGPARDIVPRTQLEKRELIMQCYLTHDTYAINSDVPGQNSARLFTVTLTKGKLSLQTTITTVPGPDSRWYVQDVQLQPLQPLCSTP